METGRLSGLVGPVTGPDGVRHMASLVGAARRELRLVTSMHPSDLDAPGIKGGGLRALRDLLATAAEPDGMQALAPPAENDSSAARLLREVLEARGFALDANVGVCGYHMDLAVRDPARPETHLLAIEIDGARYSAAPAVRDSDAAHPAALQRRGWPLARVWTTDWHADFDAALAALDDRLRALTGERRASKATHSRVA
jgi:very-short-patch-repair endonuclease